MSYLIIIGFAIIILYNIKNSKPLFVPVMLCTLFAPAINIGGNKIDGAYFIVILCIVIMFQQGRLRKPPEYLKQYFLLVILVHAIYTVSWLLISRKDAVTLVTTVLGATKLIAFMYICFNVDSRTQKCSMNKELLKLITISVIINCIAVIYEMVAPQSASNLLSEVFLNNSEISYLNDTFRNGVFRRYYGLFTYPMAMGMFSTYALVFLVNKDIEIARIERYLLVLGTLFIGIASGTKSFVLGTAVVVLANIILPLIGKKITARSLFSKVLTISGIFIFLFFFEDISNFLANIFGSFVRYPLSFITDWRKAFGTRTEALAGGWDIVKQNWLIGVGPSSVLGEAVMDNSYYVIVHNGGIIALCSVIIFYTRLFIKKRKNVLAMSLIIVLAATGMGFQTLISAAVSTWAIYYLCLFDDRTMKKRIEHILQ